MQFKNSDHAEWDAAGLKDYSEFSIKVRHIEKVDEFNFAEYLVGQWYWPDKEKLTIYYGSYGNYNSPGASAYTYAEIFESEEDFRMALAKWDAKLT